MNRKAIYIEWWDPHSSDSWDPIKDVKLKPCLALSIGFFITETDEVILMALNVNEDEGSCFMIIPKPCIRKRKWIKIPN